MRIVVTGGRDFNDAAVVERALAAVHGKHGITVLIQGEARGADRLSARWAKANGIPVEPYPAKWQLYGKRAGYLRNRQMIEEGRPDAAVAFPGGKGTANMIGLLEKRGIPVWKPVA